MRARLDRESVQSLSQDYGILYYELYVASKSEVMRAKGAHSCVYGSPVAIKSAAATRRYAATRYAFPSSPEPSPTSISTGPPRAATRSRNICCACCQTACWAAASLLRFRSGNAVESTPSSPWSARVHQTTTLCTGGFLRVSRSSRCSSV